MLLCRLVPPHTPRGNLFDPVPLLAHLLDGGTDGPALTHDLSNWILDCHSDLKEAMSAGDIKQVLELTSLQSQGAEKLAELTGGVVV